VEAPTRPSARGNGKSKIDQARAKRQTSTTQAVAATVSTPKRLAPARSIAHKPTTKNTVLPADVVARAKRRITDFFETNGRGLSWSGLVEVALLELLERDDFDAVIERHGARARRPDVK
jgi:hypothetical protein